MKRLVLIRHGQSQWNLENRFTGWTDVDLTDKGLAEAIKAGKDLKERGFQFTLAYTSTLTRAIRTLFYVLDQMDRLWVPVEKSWRLNEKHYGMLQGLNKSETAEKFGEEQVLRWRRSYDVAPDPVAPDDPRSPLSDPRYAGVDRSLIPLTECLKDTVTRMLPYWEQTIRPSLHQHDDIIVAAHGNSLRAIVKVLKGISDQDIIGVNIPTGIPYVFEFDDQLNLLKDEYIGDPETIQALMDAVANQGKKK
ncbi:MAG: 2,3-diphosphoglycerate-dependent phosphoglycerate mutase [Bacteroidia bacterium]|nr:MAG: 2,3-diphosphoglycerate-dependent phosphoglycerate mutase [Bacteroidia bacterium]